MIILILGIGDKTNAYECFAKIANAINLSAIKVDEQLKRVALNRIPLNGNIGSLLNKLCVLTNAFCACDETAPPSSQHRCSLVTEQFATHCAIFYCTNTNHKAVDKLKHFRQISLIFHTQRMNMTVNIMLEKAIIHLQ
ncbi:hypothetical protein [Treponema phagedenis]|uniref:Uncharacterized protein n=1 Tax=Treponema phagedenis TaxID=162 RepID=A0AAE6M5X2_TREPH|nr:hypothetical protein [Treponema phagedenis]QEJ96763.1 hypothetical protein FUT82_01235 [Treponema phagedenis]